MTRSLSQGRMTNSETVGLFSVLSIHEPSPCCNCVNVKMMRGSKVQGVVTNRAVAW